MFIVSPIMNTLLVFAALFAGACMADVSHIVGIPQPVIGIIENTQDAHPDGTYQYRYKTENGILAEAVGDPTGEVRGSYSYPSPDGTIQSVSWVAGLLGYRAEGDGIPPVPASVIRAVEYNAAHPYKEPVRP